jgi:hypothetical protein
MEPKKTDTDSKTRESINLLYAIIRSAETSLEEVRSACTHSQSRLGEYMFAPGHVTLSVICDHCDRILRAADIEECNAYYKDIKTFIVAPYNPLSN